MFALEISFQDGISQPEMIFIRRPQGVIGSSDYAHVVVEDLKALKCQLRLVRDLGRKFRCKPSADGNGDALPAGLEGIYDGQADLDLGGVRLHVTSLDFDLLLRETEPPDRAGVRVLRQACSTPGPLFPAVVVRGAPPMVVSFFPDQPIYIGRSKQCALRLDNPDISAKHARLGFEGGEFWVEDLGSTNGTFVNHQQISGRMAVTPGTPIILGREVTVVGVTSPDQLDRASRVGADAARRSPAAEARYPVIVSVSEVARPARLALAPGMSVVVGRDPACDMWLGAPHVSRRHCVVSMSKTGALQVQDSSTNGTAHESGVLKRGEVLSLVGTPRVFDFGGGVTVAICFNELEEKEFSSANGSLFTFQSPSDGIQSVSTASSPSQRPSFGLGAPAASAAGSRAMTLGRVTPTEQFLSYYRSLPTLGRAVIMLVFALLAIMSGVLLSLIWGMIR